ncbi:hypothetical protein BaRGS_00026909 [Batillaria attramentaria]|uniref:Uncharacterized protein n=1 Tax=Batillaria attramentaria TaxID=370345 RepID=A0ABD0K4I8_9CAEN
MVCITCKQTRHRVACLKKSHFAKWKRKSNLTDWGARRAAASNVGLLPFVRMPDSRTKMILYGAGLMFLRVLNKSVLSAPKACETLRICSLQNSDGA